MPVAEFMEVFKKNYLVYGLSDEAITEIANLGKLETCMSRETLIVRGSRNADLFVVLDGKLDVFTSTGDVLTSVGGGAVLGEVALVDDQPRSADAVCNGTVQVLRLPAKELRSYMWNNKEAGFVMLANLCRVLSARLRSADVTLEDLMGKAGDPWKLAR